MQKNNKSEPEPKREEEPKCVGFDEGCECPECEKKDAEQQAQPQLNPQQQLFIEEAEKQKRKALMLIAGAGLALFLVGNYSGWSLRDAWATYCMGKQEPEEEQEFIEEPASEEESVSQ